MTDGLVKIPDVQGPTGVFFKFRSVQTSNCGTECSKVKADITFDQSNHVCCERSFNICLFTFYLSTMHK